MTENLRNRSEILSAMNDRLLEGVTRLGEGVAEVLTTTELPERSRRSLEYVAGSGIRDMVQWYLYVPIILTGTTKVLNQELWIPVRDGSNYTLHVGNCILYSIPSRWDRSRDRWPQPPQEWFRHWRGVLDGVIEASRR